MISAQTQSFGVAVAAKNFGLSEPIKSDTATKQKQLAADNPAIEEGIVCQLRRKVRQMYEQKVKIRAIAALYGLGDCLVHSWGNFSRSREREKLQQLKSALQAKLDQGVSLAKAAKELKASLSTAEQVLGLCEDLEASQGTSVDTCMEAIRQARVSPSLNSVARRMRIPKGCIRRWLKDDFTFCGGDSRYIKSDANASATRKRRCLEEYYLTGEATKAAIATELTPEQAQAIISDFEGKISQKKTKEQGEEQDDCESEGLRVN